MKINFIQLIKLLDTVKDTLSIAGLFGGMKKQERVDLINDIYRGLDTEVHVIGNDDQEEFKTLLEDHPRPWAQGSVWKSTGMHGVFVADLLDAKGNEVLQAPSELIRLLIKTANG